jgi:hypothetical protein
MDVKVDMRERVAIVIDQMCVPARKSATEDDIHKNNLGSQAGCGVRYVNDDIEEPDAKRPRRVEQTRVVKMSRWLFDSLS